VDLSQRRVKGARPYDASARRDRARARFERTLATAEQLFLEHGYAATTVEMIATAAGTSAATVYKSSGGKAGLVRELARRALEGDDVVPAESRSDALQAADDVSALLAGWAELVAEVSPRVSPLLELLARAAQADDSAAALLAELEADRLDRMGDNARRLAGSGRLAPGVGEEEARDVMWMCTSPELYELAVVRRGWSPEQLGSFVAAVVGTLVATGD
jgi:AcrR family transcriptional regulator